MEVKLLLDKMMTMMYYLSGLSLSMIFSFALTYVLSIMMIFFGILNFIFGNNFACHRGDCNAASDDDNSITIANGPCGLGYSGNGDPICEQYCGMRPGINCANRDYHCDTMVAFDSYYCTQAIPTLNFHALYSCLLGLFLMGITTYIYFLNSSKAKVFPERNDLPETA